MSLFLSFILYFFFFFAFYDRIPQHVEFPRLGVQSDLQLLACATATALWDPNCVCGLISQLTATRDP